MYQLRSILFFAFVLSMTLAVGKGAQAQAPIPDTLSRIVIDCGKGPYKKTGLMRAAADGDTYVFQMEGTNPPTLSDITWQYKFGNGAWTDIPAAGKTVPNWGALHPSASGDSLSWTGAAQNGGSFAIKGHGKRNGCGGNGGNGGGAGGAGGDDTFDAIWEGDVDSPPIDLVIHNGQSGSAIAEGPDEEEIGAFTVANKNDTDGDGKVDNVDNDGVIANAKGRNEVDLMKLVIKKPNPDNGGPVKLTIVGGSVVIWSNETKTGAPVLTAGSKEYPTGGDWPKTLWVEATETSGALRDIVLKAEYGNTSDTVKATGIWSEVTASMYDNKSAADLFDDPEDPNDIFDPNWGDVPKSVSNRGSTQAIISRIYGGSGLRPIPTYGGLHNVIIMRFQLYPANIRNAPGIRFGFGRQIHVSAIRKDLHTGTNNVLLAKSHPGSDELPNDSDITPAGQTRGATIVPTLQDRIFQIDTPGLSDITAAGDLFIMSGNMWDFARVRFDNVYPEGNEVNGSRCSPKFLWHFRHRINKVIEEGQVVWKRSTGDAQQTDENQIAPTNTPKVLVNP